MKSVEENLIDYRQKGALIDANLLLLHFIGTFDRGEIRRNKRLARYAPEDFDLLERLVAFFNTIVTTPNIMTEVSNLSSGIPDDLREAYFLGFGKHLQVLSEQYIRSQEATTSALCRFGLTDAAIALAARHKYLVITDDFRLSQALQHQGVDALNFNHIRSISWGLIG